MQKERIYFLNTETGQELTYLQMHRIDEFRWKHLPKEWIVQHQGEKEGELYDMYLDFIDLLTGYSLQ